MARCDQCGNDYDKAFTLQRGGETWTFDSFECAIAKIAPRCGHCSCVIIGHGVETKGKMFCCAHCGEQAGEDGFQDRV